MKKTQLNILLGLLVCAAPLHVVAETGHDDHGQEETISKGYDHDEDEHEEHGDHEDSDGHEGDDSHAEHGEEMATRIDGKMAARSGIVSEKASQQTLSQTIVAYGSLATDPEQLSHVRARFPGLINSVRISIGDRVKEGDVLAEIESNESLKTYQVRSPIAGVIVQRHANKGENAQEQVLFSVANFEQLWAELRIYPAQHGKVKSGQQVHISVNDVKLDGIVSHVIPPLDKPYLLARIKIDNQSLNLSPGLLVEGAITVDQFTAQLAVKRAAIQSMGGEQGVFTKDGEEYEFTPLVFGRNDNQYIEVLGGLSQGGEYVSENSFLIKADIEKSEAEHEH